MNALTSYLHNIWSGTYTTLVGARLTLRHFFAAIGKPRRKQHDISSPDYFTLPEGINTLQYPREQMPVPEVGRYKLDIEMDDCIVCDKCAKICPVDCIEIEAVKADAVYGHTSDGTPKRLHAARFDIDMAKCCFCGLCTTVCPTDCLTMTSEYAFSNPDVLGLKFKFATFDPQKDLKPAEAPASAPSHA